jgi:8-oxo-dGTP pyrophosphatase MutT (NUDIX family)
MIKSDVVDIRGELEESACTYYNNVLTRIAAWVLIFRNGTEGKEVLMRLWRSAFYLPGGGLDLYKDGTDTAKTVEREAYEEFNYKLKNIRPTDCNY